jgi:hypothetical protein
MVCTKCRTDKSVDDFYDRHKTDSNVGRKKSICKLCQHKRNRASNAGRRREHRDRLVVIKTERGCADCGFRGLCPGAALSSQKTRREEVCYRPLFAVFVGNDFRRSRKV